jgi:hypothetical protein
MACDPNGGAPLTDMSIEPVQPILRSNVKEHQRREHAHQIFRKEMLEIAGCTNPARSNSSASHAEFAMEKDIQLQMEVGVDYAYGL